MLVISYAVTFIVMTYLLLSLLFSPVLCFNQPGKYITSLFLALSEDAVLNAKKHLKYLVKESQTPKGLNEQGLREMKKKGVFKSVGNTLNSIRKRLNK